MDRDSVMAPPYEYIAVVRSDDTPDPNGPFRGFIMDAAGAVKVTLMNGNVRTYPIGTFAAGVPHGMTAGILHVWDTGTGAQNIYGFK